MSLTTLERTLIPDDSNERSRCRAHARIGDFASSDQHTQLNRSWAERRAQSYSVNAKHRTIGLIFFNMNAARSGTSAFSPDRAEQTDQTPCGQKQSAYQENREQD